MRYALPTVEKRGAGLGNELFSWGKAFVAAQALGIRALHPAWGLNRRRYWEYFRTSRSDWFLHHALAAGLPSYRFNEADYRPFAPDLSTALLAFRDRHGLQRKKSYVLKISGLWGEFEPIRGAKNFLLGQLLTARGTAENLYQVRDRLPEGKLIVGLHVRRGDFKRPRVDFDYRGRFNCSIPLSWYQNVARGLVDRLGDNVCFLVISDSSATDLAPLTDEFNCILTSDMSGADISDMLLLSSCDLIVCSVSSYSMWAVFLSTSRYVWFEPNLIIHGQFGSIWGGKQSQQGTLSETNRAIRHAEGELAEDGPCRGVPAGWGGELTEELHSHLQYRLTVNNPARDLLRHGVVRLPPVDIAREFS